MRLGLGLGLGRSVAAPAAWTPDQVATPLAAWVAADRGSYSAGTVTTLHGQAGTPDLVDAGGAGWTWAANRYNGKPLFRGNSNLSQFRAAFTLAQPLYVYVVARCRNRARQQLLQAGGQDNRTLIQTTGTPGGKLYAGGADYACSITTPLGRLGLWKAVYNGASSSLRFNLGTPGTGNPGSVDAGGFCLGNNGTAAGGVFGFCGEVAEAFALTTDDDTNARAYVESRWPAAGDNGRSIVCVGDSLTEGYPYDFQSSYPEQLQVAHPTWCVCNYGMDGYTLASSMVAEYASVVAPAFNGNNSANILVVMAGTNDLGLGTSAADTFTALQSYVSTAQATGWDVRVCTLPAGVYPIGIGSGYNAVSASYNGMITGGYPAGKVIDLRADSRLADETNATYFQGDKLHLTPTGYGVVASLAGANTAA